MPTNMYVHREPQKGILFRIWVFADIIKVNLNTRSTLIRVGPKSNGQVFLQETEKQQTQRHIGEKAM